MRSARTVVLVPAGPRDDVVDTVDSVLAFTGPTCQVVVLDDTRGSRSGDLAHLARLVRVDVLPARGPGDGVYGALWGKLGAAFLHLLEHWDFELLVRLDADALFLGRGLEEAALARFRADPGLGLLGSYRTTSDGGTRSFAPARELLQRDVRAANLLRDRALRSRVAGLRRAARRHGYEDGEHVLGACSLLPHHAVVALREGGALAAPELARSAQGDDHLLGLAVRATGLRIGDLGRPGEPLALRWKGLPAAPAELLAAGVAVTHSVRHWQDMDEAAVRGAFRAARGASRGDGPVPTDGS